MEGQLLRKDACKTELSTYLDPKSMQNSGFGWVGEELSYFGVFMDSVFGLWNAVEFRLYGGL